MPSLEPTPRSRKKTPPLRGGGERGVASVEAVIALPVFVLLFVGLTYFGHRILAQADADALARRCAWQFSMNSCAAVPPGCAGVVGRASTSPVANEVADALSRGERKLFGQKNGGGVVEVIRSRLEGALGDVFGRSFDASASSEVVRPPLFGGSTVRVSGSYHLGCNLASQTAESVADAAWKVLIP